MDLHSVSTTTTEWSNIDQNVKTKVKALEDILSRNFDYSLLVRDALLGKSSYNHGYIDFLTEKATALLNINIKGRSHKELTDTGAINERDLSYLTYETLKTYMEDRTEDNRRILSIEKNMWPSAASVEDKLKGIGQGVDVRWQTKRYINEKKGEILVVLLITTVNSKKKGFIIKTKKTKVTLDCVVFGIDTTPVNSQQFGVP